MNHLTRKVREREAELQRALTEQEATQRAEHLAAEAAAKLPVPAATKRTAPKFFGAK